MCKCYHFDAGGSEKPLINFVWPKAEKDANISMQDSLKHNVLQAMFKINTKNYYMLASH